MDTMPCLPYLHLYRAVSWNPLATLHFIISPVLQANIKYTNSTWIQFKSQIKLGGSDILYSAATELFWETNIVSLLMVASFNKLTYDTLNFFCTTSI
jgi:hypothetical protein